MAIENIQEVIDYLSTNKDNQELSTALETNGFVKEKEVVKEVQAKYTEEGVNDFIKENQGFRDKIYNSNRDSVYKKLLGIEKDAELTEEQRQIKFVSQNQLEEISKKYSNLEKESVIKDVLGKERFEEVKELINLDKISKGEEGNWVGLELLEKLKSSQSKQSNPPSPITGGFSGQETQEQKIQRLQTQSRNGDKKAAIELQKILLNK